ncbi:hypothetical protein ACHAQH_000573 [Verticillium albo-atrum]
MTCGDTVEYYEVSPSRATRHTREQFGTSSSYQCFNSYYSLSASSAASPCAYFGHDTDTRSNSCYSPASSSHQTGDEDTSMIDCQYDNSVPTEGRSDWCVRPGYEAPSEAVVVPDLVPSSSSSRPANYEDDENSRTNWKHYKYYYADDGGFWEIRPEYAHTGERQVIPHCKPCGRTADDESNDADDSISRFVCMWPGCNAKHFRRIADLQRHYTQRHVSEELRGCHRCDHRKCARNQKAFGRLDHYRDHLRDYHKEDICKRNSSIDVDWLESRTVSQKWWRCSKCVIRVDIARHPDHICPKCKTGCEDKRKKYRGLM